jgi:biopolymer transport protein ExbD
MSHGPTNESGTIEPNLTPLLDVVLQLLMFFMMTINFVNEQVTGEVKLPTSQSAIPLSKSETDVLFINIKIFNWKDYEKTDLEYRNALKIARLEDDDPCVLVLGEKYPLPMSALKQWLKDRKRDLDQLHNGKADTTIIIRADRKLKYEFFYRILTMCKDAGFPKTKLRALTKIGAES